MLFLSIKSFQNELFSSHHSPKSLERMETYLHVSVEFPRSTDRAAWHPTHLFSVQQWRIKRETERNLLVSVEFLWWVNRCPTHLFSVKQWINPRLCPSDARFYLQTWSRDGRYVVVQFYFSVIFDRRVFFKCSYKKSIYYIQWSSVSPSPSAQFYSFILNSSKFYFHFLYSRALWRSTLKFFCLNLIKPVCSLLTITNKIWRVYMNNAACRFTLSTTICTLSV